MHSLCNGSPEPRKQPDTLVEFWKARDIADMVGVEGNTLL